MSNQFMVRNGLEAAQRRVQPYSLFSARSEEHTSELQSRLHLVCRLLLENKKVLRAVKSAGWLPTHHFLLRLDVQQLHGAPYAERVTATPAPLTLPDIVTVDQPSAKLYNP